MEIRKATPQDFEIMLNICSECILKTCYFLTTSEINKLVKVFKEKHLVDPETEFFVQSIDEEVFGFAGIRGKELLYSHIDPRLFGKGWAEKMVEYLFREYGVDTAYVYCSDIDSLAFYSKLGFIIDDKIKDTFFNNPYDVNRLKLSMTPLQAADKIAADLL